MSENVVNVDFSPVSTEFEDPKDFIDYSAELLDLTTPGAKVIIIGKDKEGQPIIGCNYDIATEEQRALLIYALSQAKWAMHHAIDGIEDV